MITVSDRIEISEKEISFQFVKASGPGGQNVNKVSTAVQLKFNFSQSHALSETVKERLSRIAKGKINKKGVLLIEAKRYRTQEENKQDAINRLIKLVRKAEELPRIRVKSKKTKASIERRIESKKIKSEIKKTRKSLKFNDY